jgi:8-oxo-dGTP pyrophosphatase MutT (NUDIX family)
VTDTTGLSPVLNLAGCVVCDSGGRIVLIHRNMPGRRQWEIPGGKVEPGESDAAAAAREFEEELGARPVIDRLLGTRLFTEDTRQMRYTWFAASLGGQHLRVVEPQHDHFAYFTSGHLRGRDDLSAAARLFVEELDAGRIVLNGTPT